MKTFFEYIIEQNTQAQNKSQVNNRENPEFEHENWRSYRPVELMRYYKRAIEFSVKNATEVNKNSYQRGLSEIDQYLAKMLKDLIPYIKKIPPSGPMTLDAIGNLEYTIQRAPRDLIHGSNTRQVLREILNIERYKDRRMS